MRIYLGNSAVLQSVRHDDGVLTSTERPDLAGAPTVIDAPDTDSLLDVLKNAADLWSYHSSENPTWLAAENEMVARMLSEQFKCEIRPYAEAVAMYEKVEGGESDPN